MSSKSSRARRTSFLTRDPRACALWIQKATLTAPVSCYCRQAHANDKASCYLALSGSEKRRLLAESWQLNTLKARESRQTETRSCLVQYHHCYLKTGERLFPFASLHRYGNVTAWAGDELKLFIMFRCQVKKIKVSYWTLAMQVAIISFLCQTFPML